MKRIVLILAIAAAITTFSGCVSFNPNADALMHPPQLTTDQQDVYDTLISAAGSNIKLLYPKRGEYRSAFVFYDIDGDGAEEAVAFYAPKDNENNIRMAVLSKVQDKWRIKYDSYGPDVDADTVKSATEVDTVAFSDNKIYIGYVLSQKKDYLLCVYSAGSDKPERYYTANYSYFSLNDMDGDGQNELMLISKNSVTQNTTLKMIKDMNGSMNVLSSVALDPSVTQYTNIISGTLPDNSTALYLDGKVGQVSMMTQIILYQNGSLVNPLLSGDLTNTTLRSQLIPSHTAQTGGFVEIPYLVPMPGYESSNASEKVFLTQWEKYTGSEMQVVHTQFVSLTYGFALEFPSKWIGQVTAKYDYETSEIKFYKYTGNIDNDNQEYLRIRIVDKNSNQEISPGYVLIGTAGTTEYTAYITGSSSDSMTMSIEEVMMNFSRFGW